MNQSWQGIFSLWRQSSSRWTWWVSVLLWDCTYYSVNNAWLCVFLNAASDDLYAVLRHIFAVSPQGVDTHCFKKLYLWRNQSNNISYNENTETNVFAAPEPSGPCRLPGGWYAYRSTIHEIAHCAHHKWSRSTYRHCDKIVKESWARGVAYYVARAEGYGDDGEYFSNPYTGLVLSLTRDDFGDRVKTSGGSVEYHLRKFTLSEVERCLKGCTKWNQWRDKLKNTQNGKGQEKEIDKIFDAWTKCATIQ